MAGITARVSRASGQLMLQHDDDDEGQHEDVFEDGEDAGGEHLVERVDVGGDAGDEFADGVAVEEGGGHALQMAEDLAAQIEHDLLPGPLHHVGLQEFEDVGDEQRAEVEEADLRDAGHGMRAEMAGEPGELLRRRVRHVGVDGDLDQIGADDVAAGLEDDGDGRECGLQLVRAEVGQQTTHEAAVVGLADDVVILQRLSLRNPSPGLSVSVRLPCVSIIPDACEQDRIRCHARIMRAI